MELNSGKILVVFSLICVGAGLLLSLLDFIFASLLEFVGVVGMLIWVLALRANKLGLDRDCFQKRKSSYLVAYLLFSIVFLAITRGVKSVAYHTYHPLSRVLLFIWVLSFVLVVYLHIAEE